MPEKYSPLSPELFSAFFTFSRDTGKKVLAAVTGGEFAIVSGATPDSVTIPDGRNQPFVTFYSFMPSSQSRAVTAVVAADEKNAAYLDEIVEAIALKVKKSGSQALAVLILDSSDMFQYNSDKPIDVGLDEIDNWAFGTFLINLKSPNWPQPYAAAARDLTETDVNNIRTVPIRKAFEHALAAVDLEKIENKRHEELLIAIRKDIEALGLDPDKLAAL